MSGSIRPKVLLQGHSANAGACVGACCHCAEDHEDTPQLASPQEFQALRFDDHAEDDELATESRRRFSALHSRPDGRGLRAPAM